MIQLKNVRYRGTRGGGLGAAPSPEMLRAQADGFDKAAVALDGEVERKTQQAAVMRGHNLEGPAQGVLAEVSAAKKKAAEARSQAKALREQANAGSSSGVPPAVVLVGLAALWWAFGPRG